MNDEYNEYDTNEDVNDGSEGFSDDSHDEVDTRASARIYTDDRYDPYDRDEYNSLDEDGWIDSSYEDR